MSRADEFEFTLDEDTEKRLYELLTDMDTRNTDRFCIKDKRGYHAEYVKVRHGHWIRTGRPNVYGGIELVCSECGDHVMVQHIEDELYCRHCGARLYGARYEE